MKQFFSLFGGAKTFFIAAIVLVLAIIFVVLSLLFGQSGTTRVPENQIPTPTLFPDKLTEDEEALPTAVPQVYFNDIATKRGTLVIMTDISNVNVLIDSGEGEAPINEIENPFQTPPFVVPSLPIGQHTLIAGKEGYIFEEMNFEIFENQVTRVELNLIPLE
jgi:hypothetical protein